jgi:AraC-like DNA-binding protein
MEVHRYIPHVALQPYVVNIATIHAVLPQGMANIVSPYPPTPFQSMIFYGHDPVSMGTSEQTIFQKQPLAVIIGPQCSRVNVQVHHQLRAVRVDFLPGGLFRLLHIPMHELVDEGLDAEDVFGETMKHVNDQLLHSASLEECKNHVENFLVAQVNKLKESIPFDLAMRSLLYSNGTMTMEKVADLSCLSVRQLERKCKERIGMNPKYYARIIKFSTAYRLRESYPDMPWLEIAYRAGYYDQMHMIRDFKTFAGVNPSIVEQQLLSTPIRMQKDLQY